MGLRGKQGGDSSCAQGGQLYLHGALLLLEMLLPGKLMSCLCLQKEGWGLYGKYQYAFALSHMPTRKEIPTQGTGHTPVCPSGTQVSTR